MLAAAGLGAVFSSCSPDFGTRGVLDRFGQIEPVGARRRRRLPLRRPHASTASSACARSRPSCRPCAPSSCSATSTPRPTSPVSRARSAWDDWLGATSPRARSSARRCRSTTRCYVLYSSGTTGLPKCIVHRAGGVLLKHLVEHQLHCDVQPGDRVFYFTTTGWMMWNWLASRARERGARSSLYDGSPTAAGGRVLWDLADELGITLFGTSAKFLDACRQARPAPRRHARPRHACARSPRPARRSSPEGFEYVYDAIKADVHLASISGGTDLCGCLVAGDPTGPVWAGEIQRPGARAWRSTCSTTPATACRRARRGELVCTAPFPSMPLGFWDDPGDARYRAAYFERFPGVWHQGDFAELDRARRHRDPRAGPTPRSTRAACASAPPRSTARSRRSTRWSRAS